MVLFVQGSITELIIRALSNQLSHIYIFILQVKGLVLSFILTVEHLRVRFVLKTVAGHSRSLIA